jgi:glycosyltransferase involved in cell wall biosynthesis
MVFGSTPIINNSYWARALRSDGYKAETFTSDFYSINSRSDWDRILSEEYRFVHPSIKPFVAFLSSLLRYDVFVISCDGFFIGHTKLWRFQGHLLKLAAKKVIVIPYGSDAYVYKRIKSTNLTHALLMSYPLAARQQKKVGDRLDYWCRMADIVIPGFMGPDGFGRWDVLIPSPLSLDLNQWKRVTRNSSKDGTNEIVTIAHAPNHRGFKGTEFVISAVKSLQDMGLKVELRLLEGLSNDEVRRVLSSEVDILVEQLIFTGHGLNGLEGMACGLPTISNLEDDNYIQPIKRWSYFSECPLVSASPETLVETLVKLVTRPELRNELGYFGRQYVEKYHGLDSSVFLFNSVLQKLTDSSFPLIDLYQPLSSEYVTRLPLIEAPLVDNTITD